MSKYINAAAFLIILITLLAFAVILGTNGIAMLLQAQALWANVAGVLCFILLGWAVVRCVMWGAKQTALFF